MSRRLPGALALALGSAELLPSPALANGRFPRADQLVQTPGRPEALWLRATFGLLRSSDAGQSWDWICERAIGFTGQEDPALGVLPDGTVLAGLGAGLSSSRDGGCAWAFEALPATSAPGELDSPALPDRLPITDVSVRATAPGAAVVLAWGPQAVSASTPGYRSRFFATEDGGQTWVARGDGLDPSVLALTVDVAPSEPRRLYASGIRPGMRRTAALFVSTDGGQSWVERPVPFDAPSEQGLYIAAVDPLDAERVYLRTSGATTSRLLVTRDAGLSFEKPFAGGPMLGFALAPDGATLYLGGPDDGLWVASRDALLFERRSDLPVACLLRTTDALYACSSDGAGGFTVGASTDEGQSFEPRLFLSSVRGPLACEAGSAASACASEWPLMARRLGIDAAESAAPPTTLGPVGEASQSSGCGLSRAGAGRPPALEALAALAAAWGAARRRRRASTPAP